MLDNHLTLKVDSEKYPVLSQYATMINTQREETLTRLKLSNLAGYLILKSAYEKFSPVSFFRQKITALTEANIRPDVDNKVAHGDAISLVRGIRNYSNRPQFTTDWEHELFLQELIAEMHAYTQEHAYSHGQ